MRQDKDLAFKLRKEGKSYRSIQKELGISRSTLCDWFKNVEWSKHIKHKNNKENISISSERLKSLIEGRRRMLEDKYKKIEEEAEKEFDIYIKEPLFNAGLMLYAGEGDKRSRHITRISNSEFYIHKIFIKFSERYLKINKKDIKIQLISYEDLDQDIILKKWAEELEMLPSYFYKVQIIKGREKTKKLQYGIGISIISSKVIIKKKILKWIEIYSSLEF